MRQRGSLPDAHVPAAHTCLHTVEERRAAGGPHVVDEVQCRSSLLVEGQLERRDDEHGDEERQRQRQRDQVEQQRAHAGKGGSNTWGGYRKRGVRGARRTLRWRRGTRAHQRWRSGPAARESRRSEQLRWQRTWPQRCCGALLPAQHLGPLDAAREPAATRCATPPVHVRSPRGRQQHACDGLAHDDSPPQLLQRAEPEPLERNRDLLQCTGRASTENAVEWSCGRDRGWPPWTGIFGALAGRMPSTP